MLSISSCRPFSLLAIIAIMQPMELTFFITRTTGSPQLATLPGSSNYICWFYERPDFRSSQTAGETTVGYSKHLTILLLVTWMLWSCQHRSNPMALGPIAASKLLRLPSNGPLDQPSWIANVMVLLLGNMCANALNRRRWLLNFQVPRKLNGDRNQRRYKSTYDINFAITFCITTSTDKHFFKL